MSALNLRGRKFLVSEICRPSNQKLLVLKNKKCYISSMLAIKQKELGQKSRMIMSIRTEMF